MSSSVCYESNEIHIFSFFTSEQSVNGFNHHLDNIDILPLVKSSDIIGISYFSFMEDQINSFCMIFHEEPIAYIFTFSIYGQWFAMTYIVNKQRNQLLRELIGSVVIRTVCHHYRHSVCIVESSNEMVRTCLRCRIWRVWVILCCFEEELFSVSQMVLCRRSCCSIWWFDTLWMCQFKSSIHFVGRNMIESFSFIFFGQ